MTSPLPIGIYNDFANSALGLSTLTVWPVPSAVVTLGLYLPTEIASPLSLQTLLTFPKGYAKALTKQLGTTDPDDWPFVNGRFLKPDTIISVDIEPS